MCPQGEACMGKAGEAADLLFHKKRDIFNDNTRAMKCKRPFLFTFASQRVYYLNLNIDSPHQEPSCFAPWHSKEFLEFVKTMNRHDHFKFWGNQEKRYRRY